MNKGDKIVLVMSQFAQKAYRDQFDRVHSGYIEKECVLVTLDRAEVRYVKDTTVEGDRRAESFSAGGKTKDGREFSLYRDFRNAGIGDVDHWHEKGGNGRVWREPESFTGPGGPLVPVAESIDGSH